MGYVVKMPKLGLEMESGVVLEWAVEVDEAVAEGEVIAEVESEKSIGEVEAREDGALRHVYVEEGGEVPPGTPIGIVAAPDADISDLRADAEAELEATAPEAAPSGGGDAGSTADTGAASPEPGATDAAAADSPSGASGADVRASPRARKRAEELGVDLGSVDGTGYQGSVTEEDVEAAAGAGSDGAEADADADAAEDLRASPRARKRAEELGVDLGSVEGTGYQGSITEEDVEAAEPTAAGTEAPGPRWVAPDDEAADRYRRSTAVADPAAAEGLFETTEAVRAAFEERVTMTDLLVVVASATLADHPVVNGTYAESTHQLETTHDVALVADADGEPVAGVLEDVRNRSLSELVDARRAIDGSGDPSAATFSLANAAETDATGRLVNPPAVAALSVDPTGQRAVPDGDGVDLRRLVTAELTYDSRAIGEADARAFLEGFLERAGRASELVLGSYRGHE